MRRLTTVGVNMVRSLLLVLFILIPRIATAQTCVAGEIKSVSAGGAVTSYPTIQAAINASGSGATIDIGTVNGNEYLMVQSKTNLTIKTVCGAKVHGFDIEKSTGITVDGFLVDGTGNPNKHGILVDGNNPAPNNITIKNCEIKNSEKDGVNLGNKTLAVTLLGNYIHDNGKSGVVTAGDGPYVIRSNTIAKNDDDGIHAKKPDNIVIDQNTITQNGSYGLNLDGVKKIDSQVLITANVIYLNDGNERNNRSTQDIADYPTTIHSGDVGNTTTSGIEGSPGGGAVNDNTAPAIAIDVADNSFVNLAALTANIEITEAGGANTQVFLNNVLTKTTALKSFSQTFQLLDGANTIRVTSTDLANHVTTITRTVTFQLVPPDHDAPAVNVTSMVPPTTTTASLAIDLSIQDASNVTTKIFVNGIERFSGTQKIFQAVVPLDEGSNNVQIECVDAANNTAAPILYSVLRDSIAPILAVVPADGAQILVNGNKLFAVSVQANEALQNASVNGVPLVGFGTSFSGQISFPSGGAQTLHVVAQDLIGNVVIKDVSINYEIDTLGPVIVLGVTDGLKTANPQLILPVTVTENHGAVTRLILNGTEVLSTSQKNFSANLTLASGGNTILVTSVDEVGNPAVAKTLSNITLDDVAPQLTVLDPLEGQLFEDSAIDIAGMSSEPLASISVNGQPLAFSLSANIFTGVYDFGSNVGPQTLHLLATDNVGNQTSMDISVLIQPVVLHDLAYVANKAGGKISVLDFHSHQLLREITLAQPDPEEPDSTSGAPHNIEFTVQKDRAFVFSVGFEQLDVVNLKDGSVITGIDLPTNDGPDDGLTPVNPIAVSPTGLAVYLAKAQVEAVPADPEIPGDVDSPERLGGVTIFNTETDEFETVDFPNISPDSIAIDSNGSKLYLSTSHDSIAIFDVSLKTVIDSIQLPDNQFHTLGVFLSPDDSKLYVTGEDSRVFIYDVASKSLIQTVSILNAGSRLRDLLFNANGGKAYIFSRAETTSYMSVLETASNTVTGTVDLGMFATSVRYSPDHGSVWISGREANIIKVLQLGDLTFIDSFAANAPAGVVFGTENAEAVPNLPPLASFTFSPGSGIAPATFQFDASLSDDADGSIVSRKWTFGDGGVASGIRVSHKFSNPGVYPVTLTVVDNHGAKRAKISEIEVFDKNAPPLAKFVFSRVSDFGFYKFDFDASTSIKPGGQIVSYLWSFGDGKTASGVTVSHTYADAGQYFVELRVVDEEGNQGVITKPVQALDVSPLNIIVSSPKAGARSTVASVEVIGQTDEPASFVRINGVDVTTGMNHSFSQTVNLPLQGRNIIVIEAADQSGNIARLNLPVIVDTVVPTLSNFNPANGLTLYRQSAQFNLSFQSNELLKTLAINGDPVAFNANSTQQSLVIPAVAGPVSLNLSFGDLVGNLGNQSLNYNLIVDSVAPVISLSANDDVLTANPSFSFNVDVLDATPVNSAVLQNGIPLSMSLLDSFSVSSNLLEGQNSFQVTSTDAAGNVSVKNLNSIVLDSIAPQINLSAADGMYTNSPSLNLAVNINEAHPYTSGVYLNGNLIQASAANSYSVPLSLVEGINTIVVTAQDGAGNMSSKQIVVHLDTVAPILSELFPADGSTQAERALSMFASAASNEPLKRLTVNGQDLSLNIGEIKFFGMVPVPALGPVTFLFEGMDRAGNVTQASVNFEYHIDMGPPILTTNMQDNQRLNSSSLSFQVQVADISTTITSVFQNGQQILQTDSKDFNVNLTLNEGNNVIELRSQDETSGYAATPLIFSNIIVDTLAPVISNRLPFDGAISLDNKFVFSGSVNEPIASAKVGTVDLVVAANGLSFSGEVTFAEANGFTATLSVTDLAGNQTEDQIPLSIRIDNGPNNNLGHVDLGTFTSCEIFGGAAKCWGQNQFGQVGNNSVLPIALPTQVIGMDSGVTKIKTGPLHVCAVKDGQVYCWGNNSFGQLGMGFTGGGRLSPVLATQLTGPIDDLEVGLVHTCIVSNGAVKCVGANFRGTLGTGTIFESSATAVTPVGLGSNVTEMYTKFDTNCALQSGHLKCWGQLAYPTPIENPNLASASVELLSIWDSSICAKINGVPSCWGSNRLGQLGNGTILDDNQPGAQDAMTGVPGPIVGLGGDVQYLAAGYHGCAILTTGALQCWGLNNDAELGTGVLGTNPVPQQVVGLDSGVSNVYIGDYHTCAIHNGIFKCWGNNQYGQVGIGTPSLRELFPVAVVNPVVSFATAIFTMDPIRPQRGQQINLDGSASFDPGGAPIQTYRWTFDDGSTFLGNPTILPIPNTVGLHSITLKVTTANSSGESTRYFIVEDAVAPTANFNFALNTGSGLLKVAFDGSASNSIGFTIDSYSWNFGDGNSAIGAQTEHTYSQPGTYTARLTVHSTNGLTGELIKVIDVRDWTPPVLTLNPLGNNGNSVLSLSGSSNEALSSLTINNQQVSLNQDLISFLQSINISAVGDHRFHVVARDLAGNMSVNDFTATIDAQKPSLLTFSPAHGGTTYTKTQTIPISGQANEPLSSAKVNGQSLTVNGANFSGNLNFAAGAQVLNVEIKDLAGNPSTFQANITHVIDNVVPVVTANQAGNVLTRQAGFTFLVSVSDATPTTTTVKQNGVVIETSADEYFNVNATLAEGVNTFEISSLDSAGNLSLPTFISNVQLDTIAPVITIASPLANATVTTYSFAVTGSANERIQSIEVGGKAQTIAADGLNFSGTTNAPALGQFSLPIHAVDLAGNEANYALPLNFSIILNPALIGTEKAPNNRVRIFGQPGAVLGGLTVNAKAGFFNTNSTVAAGDGSFSMELDFFRIAKVSVTDPGTGRTDSADVSFEVITRVAGVVKDTAGAPIVGAKVSVSGSQAEVLTDIAGSFNILNPPTGNQRLIVDASELSNDQREYSATSVAVNIGVNQDNILENPVYVAALVKDGSETLLTELGGTRVRSENAPGVELVIPNGVKATFPNGGNSGNVNISIVPADRTTIPTPDFAKPTNVVYLEPSGLTLPQRVQLVLPNDSELPPGVEMVVLSMNEDGSWEADGLATVSPNGQSVVTKDGQGISHFSPKYAVPLGPVVREYKKFGQPGIDTFNGSLTTKVQMPSFKSLGQDVTPSLIYKSAWAKPTALVTNFFDVPAQRVEFQGGGVVTAVKKLHGYKIHHEYCQSDTLSNSKCFDDFFNYWVYRDKAKAGEVVRGASWYQPDSIKAQFFVSGLTSEEITNNSPTSQADINFNTMTWQGIPNQALMSFGVDLKNDPESDVYFKTGIYPTLAHYEMKIRNVTLSTRKSFVTGDNNRKVITQENKVETSILDDIFPSDLQSPIFVQNETKSAAGRGWKIAGVQKIHSPTANRIVVEEASGDVSLYNANFTIETLFNAEGSKVNLARGVSLHSWPNAAVVREEGLATKIQKIDLSSASPAPVDINAQLPNLSGVVKSAELCPGTGTVWKSSGWKYRQRNHSFTIPRQVTGLFLAPSGELYGSDGFENSLFSLTGSGYSNIVRKTVLPKIQSSFLSGYERQVTSLSALQKYCTATLHTSCAASTLIQQFGCSSDTVVSKGKVRYRYNDSPASNIFRSGSGNLNTGSVPSTDLLNAPMGVVAGPDNMIYIADTGHNQVVKVNPANGARTIVAGTGSTTDSGDEGPAIQAGLFHPRGLAFDNVGNLYVSTENGFIRKITADGMIWRFAGAKLGDAGALLEDQVHAGDMALQSPTGIVINQAANIMYVADTKANRVMQINLADFRADVVAGVGTGKCNASNLGDGGSSLNACVSAPTWLGLDDQNRLLIVDSGNGRIRRVSFATSSDSSLTYVPSKFDNSTLVRNSDGTLVRKHRNGTQDFFDSTGLQTSSLDRVGRQVTFGYDQGRLALVVDPVGQQIDYNYSGDKLVSMTDPANRTTQFFYSGDLLDRVRYPDGTFTKYVYTPDGLMTEERNQRDLPTKYQYNAQNRLAKVIKPDNAEIVVNDALADTAGNGYTGGSVGELQSMESGIVDSIKSPRGVETRFSKDLNGIISKVEDGLGRITQIESDLNGMPVKVTKFDGETPVSVTSFRYDANTRDLVQTVDETLQIVESQTYDEFGNTLSQTNGRGKVTQHEYFSTTGLLRRTTFHTGEKVEYTYFPNGLQQSQKVFPASGTTLVTSYEYDQDGNLTRTVLPDGKEKFFTYDLAGNVLESSTRSGATELAKTKFRYDLTNRLDRVTSAQDELTHYGYLPTGEVETITDSKGKVTLFEYDFNGNLTKKTDSLGFVWEFTYNQDGNLSTIKDPNTNIETRNYDAINRLSSIQFADDLVQFTYDVRDQISKMQNNTTIVFSPRNAKGWITQNRVVGVGALTSYPDLSIALGYDKGGNVTDVSSDIGSMTYNYDDLNRLTSLGTSVGHNFIFSYDNASRLTQMQRPGSATNYSYTGSGSLSSIQHVSGATVVSLSNYVYDLRNYVSQKGQLSGSTNYSYTANGNLATTSGQENQVFAYDDLGNRVSDSSGNYSYDSTGQRLMEDWQYYYQYDNNGNLLAKNPKNGSEKAYTFAYSSKNQLVEARVINGGALGVLSKQIFFAYDALGRRIEKRVIDYIDSSKSYTRQFVYNGDNIFAEFDGSGSLLAKYTYSPLRADDVLSVDISTAGASAGLAQEAGSYFFLKDAQGSVTDIVSASGILVQRFEYESFGAIQKIYSSVGTDITNAPLIGTSYAYTGRELDREFGMYYYRARYYDPTLGRFIQADPYSGSINDPMSVVNRYSYVSNNPMNFVDPSGRFLDLIGTAILGHTVGDRLGLTWNKFATIVIGATIGTIWNGSIGAHLGTLAAINFSGKFSQSEIAFANKLAAVLVLSGAVVATGGLGATSASTSAFGFSNIGLDALVVAFGSAGANAALQKGDFVDNFLNSSIRSLAAAIILTPVSNAIKYSPPGIAPLWFKDLAFWGGNAALVGGLAYTAFTPYTGVLGSK